MLFEDLNEVAVIAQPDLGRDLPHRFIRREQELFCLLHPLFPDVGLRRIVEVVLDEFAEIVMIGVKPFAEALRREFFVEMFFDVSLYFEGEEITVEPYEPLVRNITDDRLQNLNGGVDVALVQHGKVAICGEHLSLVQAVFFRRADDHFLRGIDLLRVAEFSDHEIGDERILEKDGRDGFGNARVAGVHIGLPLGERFDRILAVATVALVQKLGVLADRQTVRLPNARVRDAIQIAVEQSDGDLGQIIECGQERVEFFDVEDDFHAHIVPQVFRKSNDFLEFCRSFFIFFIKNMENIGAFLYFFEISEKFSTLL